MNALETLPSVESMLAHWQAVAAAAFADADFLDSPAFADAPAKPAATVITITTARVSAQYRVSPINTTWGSGFTLAKLAGDREVYSVLIGKQGEPDRCDCAAATFRHHKPCKHVMACRKLVATVAPTQHWADSIDPAVEAVRQAEFLASIGSEVTALATPAKPWRNSNTARDLANDAAFRM